jgi:tRNA G18 (ribose-2'-O)-methylase SpoU
MKNTEIHIVLDNVRSALNVGAIFRTCDGVGVATLHLCGICPGKNHPKVAKTALGAENFVDSLEHASTREAIETLQSEGFTVVAVEQSENSVPYASLDFNMFKKVAIVMGHEITGVDPEVMNLADFIVELPMLGNKQSLNVATTTGIIAYHIRFGLTK